MVDPITLSVIVGVSLTAVAVGTYNHIKKIREESDFQRMQIAALVESINQYTESYQFEDCDQEMIGKCRKLVSRTFSTDINAKFRQIESLEERIELFKSFAVDLANEMNIQIDEIRFEELHPTQYGQMAIDDDGKFVVTLNVFLLEYDCKQLIQTLCHEYRHVLQTQALQNNLWGYSPQRLAQWLYSSDNYLNPYTEAVYLAYRSQIIEIDAIKFSEEVLKN